MIGIFEPPFLFVVQVLLQPDLSYSRASASPQNLQVVQFSHPMAAIDMLSIDHVSPAVSARFSVWPDPACSGWWQAYQWNFYHIAA
jgi:hypothetical protein